jgi:glucokinase
VYLAVEIGGTKLQLAVATEAGKAFLAQHRSAIDPAGGAEGILETILKNALPLIQKFDVRSVGIGFGGPVDRAAGRIIECHQVDGWNGFPLVEWTEEHLQRPACLANDSDAAGLAEAHFGAGQGRESLFYTNSGSGIGGAFILGGNIHSGHTGIASEIGQCRPGPTAVTPDDTVESAASGWGIAQGVRQYLEGKKGPLEAYLAHPFGAEVISDNDPRQLLSLCGGSLAQLTTRQIAEAAGHGNIIARAALDRACRVHGWAIAQVVTLLSPSIVVVGGGVSLIERPLFFEPLKRYIDQYVFPAMKNHFILALAHFEEEVVLHGALALAALRCPPPE